MSLSCCAGLDTVHAPDCKQRPPDPAELNRDAVSEAAYRAGYAAGVAWARGKLEAKKEPTT